MFDVAPWTVDYLEWIVMHDLFKCGEVWIVCDRRGALAFNAMEFDIGLIIQISSLNLKGPGFVRSG